MNAPLTQAVAPTTTSIPSSSPAPTGSAATTKNAPAAAASVPAPTAPVEATKPKAVAKPKSVAKSKASAAKKAAPVKKEAAPQVMASTDANHQSWQALKRELTTVMSDLLYDSRRVNPDHAKSQEEATAKVTAALKVLTEFTASIRLK